jgi:Fe-S cluster assembly scaffold protein SufB
MNIQVTKPNEKVTLKEPGEYTVELVEPGAEVEIGGVYVSKGSEIINVKILIVHKAPHTRARTTLKGAAYDKSMIKLSGKIVIEESAFDTNSFLTEKILLLSPEAKAEAVPDLEIKTDDVKCSHAATISKIPDEELFYLESRGLSESEAKELIVDGFLGKD